jgi:hypothetical protein
MDARPGGPAAKREPSPEGLGINPEDDLSAVGAALTLGPLAPVSLGAKPRDLRCALPPNNCRQLFHHNLLLTGNANPPRVIPLSRPQAWPLPRSRRGVLSTFFIPQHPKAHQQKPSIHNTNQQRPVEFQDRSDPQKLRGLRRCIWLRRSWHRLAITAS